VLSRPLGWALFWIWNLGVVRLGWALVLGGVSQPIEWAEFPIVVEVVPERMPAAGNGANCAMVFSGTDPETGRLDVYLETLAGGASATAVGDGMDAVQVHVTSEADDRMPRK
jgi:N-methylhydantoinase B/oxoprolinase/acetone carboxylase alpha subunit